MQQDAAGDRRIQRTDPTMLAEITPAQLRPSTRGCQKLTDRPARMTADSVKALRMRVSSDRVSLSAS